jgi:hypothetical protein
MPPETFCRSLGMRISRSAALLSQGTVGSVANRRQSSIQADESPCQRRRCGRRDTGPAEGGITTQLIIIISKQRGFANGRFTLCFAQPSSQGQLQ